jgi:hypothetical protein
LPSIIVGAHQLDQFRMVIVRQFRLDFGLQAEPATDKDLIGGRAAWGLCHGIPVEAGHSRLE